MISDQARDDLLEMIVGWAQEHAQADSVEQAEQLGQETGAIVRQAVAQQAVNDSIARSEQAVGRVVCACGGEARLVDRRARVLVSLCGELRVRRRYYHCAGCRRGWAPWDRAQGLTQRQFTPQVKAQVSEVCARLPYGETVELLAQLSGLRIEESCAEQIVAEVGARVRGAQQGEIAAARAGELAATVGPERLYVAVDGAHAHVAEQWHEVKHVMAEVEGGPRRYDAALETASTFGERMYRLAAQLGVEQAGEVVMLGDGAEWIWNLSELHFPGAVEILDYYHACEYIHAVATAHYGEADGGARRWAEGHKQRLLEEGPEPLLRALAALRPTNATAAEVIARTRGYVLRHRARMRYPQFRARGLRIGSGPVEAACKVITAQRLKQAGMRWSATGADAILALRCLLKSGQRDQIRRYARAA